MDFKPQILLIGDSIRMGYCETVKNEMESIAEVIYPEENCRSSQHMIIQMPQWEKLTDAKRVQVVQFNCGHWDTAHFWRTPECLTSETEYKKNLRALVFLIRKFFPNAKIVWASTTPMNPTGEIGDNPRTTEEIVIYNAIAKAVMDEENVPVNDLFAIAKDFGADKYIDYCHMTAEGFEIIGKAVAAYLGKVLG